MSDFKQLSRSVKGLTVLVTGAAGGMGRATARVFAAEGAAVTDFSAGGRCPSSLPGLTRQSIPFEKALAQIDGCPDQVRA